MKVLHVAETIKGGIGTYLDELVPLQLERYGRDNVRVLVPESQAKEVSSIPAACVHGYSDTRNRVVNALRLMRVWRGVRSAFAPDVVHAHSTFAGAALRVGRAITLGRAGPALIYTPHGWAFYRETGSAVRSATVSIERILARFANAIVCVSNHERHLASSVGIDPRRLAVVLNGVSDLEPGYGCTEGVSWPGASDAKKVLYVGRFDRQKGVDRLVQILQRVGSDVSACVIGAPVTQDEAPPTFPSNAQTLGWMPRQRVAAYMRLADVLVVPSRWEGLCLVGIEALRAGKPVFATDIGGMDDIVEDGVNGFLISGDVVEGFVQCLRSIDAEQLREMAVAARRRYEERFRIERVVHELDAIYRAWAPVAASVP